MNERFIPLYGFLSCDSLRESYAETTVRKIYDLFDKAEIVVYVIDVHPHLMGNFCWSLELRKGKLDESIEKVASGLENIITKPDRALLKLDITTALKDFMARLEDEDIGFIGIKRNFRNFNDTSPHDIDPLGIRIEIQSSEGKASE